jgi:putative ABC transport system permease protein
LGPASRASRLLVADAIGSHGIAAAYQLAWLDNLLQRVRRMPPLVAMAIRNLARRSARNLITISFSAAATASLLAALSTSRSVNLAIEQIFTTYRADAWIWLNEYVSTHYAGSLRAMEDVDRAEAWVLQDAWVNLAPVRLWGLPADTTLYAPDIVEGRWYRPDERTAMVISTDLAESYRIGVGDRVQVDTGETTREFQVVGLAVDNAIFLGGATAGKAFIARETVESMLQRRGIGYFYALSLTPEARADPDAALNRIERRFRYLRPVTESAQRDMESAGEQSRLLSISLYAMTILIAIAGGLGVANTLTLNVLERRREIGVMRAIGASNRNLIQLFLTEGLVMGLLSWILGTIIAYPAGRLLLLLLEGVLFEIPYIFAPTLVLLGGAFSTLLAVSASLLPALGAAQLPTQEALRYE